MEEQAEILKRQYHLRFAESGEYRDRVWQILWPIFGKQFIVIGRKKAQVTMAGG